MTMRMFKKNQSGMMKMIKLKCEILHYQIDGFYVIANCNVQEW